MAKVSQSQRKHVFISYSHADTEWLRRLKRHLKPLEREGAIDLWSDSVIKPGSKWREEIRTAVEKAKVAILLISADFLASDFIDKDELPPLLTAAEKEDAIILPVIVSKCMFDRKKSLSKFQAVNPPDEPLNGMGEAEQEEVFDKVARIIDDMVIQQDDNKETEKIVSSIEEIQPKEQTKKKTSRKAKWNREKKTTLFRSTPTPLLKREVKKMLVERDFFASDWNPGGRGFNNDFEIQEDGKVVFDRASGLMWQQSGSDNDKSNKEAQTCIAVLNRKHFAGFDDWRLPTMEEAMSLLTPVKNSDELYIDQIFDKNQVWIWTSDPYSGIFGPSASRAWVVGFNYGNCLDHLYYFDDYYVRAVR